MSTHEKNSFVLYVNFGKQLRMLSMEERGELITAIFEHEEHGHVLQSLSPRTELIYSFIEDTLERDRIAYEKKCEQNRKNGKRGGRPGKSTGESDRHFFDEETERFSKKAKKADNDNENENDNENDNENENGNGNGNDNGNENGNGNENEKKTPLALYGAEPPGAEPQGTPCPAAQEGIGVFGDADYLVLIDQGVSGSFIRKKLERATQYSIRHRVSVVNVLREWWRRDLQNGNVGSDRDPIDTKGAGTWEFSCSSFDTDDFGKAALEYSRRILDANLL